jgi:hypothetical protein
MQRVTAGLDCFLTVDDLSLPRRHALPESGLTILARIESCYGPVPS